MCEISRIAEETACSRVTVGALMVCCSNWPRRTEGRERAEWLHRPIRKWTCVRVEA